ncbi:unnamed protein product, partial [Xylocopa violacea]
PLGLNQVGPESRKQASDDYNDSAGGPSGSSGPTKTSEAMLKPADAFQCRMPGCGRAFATSTGRGVHEQRAHKNWYDEKKAELITNKKTPWNAEELALLARKEASMVANGVKFINQALVPYFPNRTLESIKGQRRYQRYKDMVLQFVQELRNEEESCCNVLPDQQVELEDQSLDYDYNALAASINEQFAAMEPLKGTAFHAIRLGRVCDNITRWNLNRISDELEMYLLEVFPLTPKRGKQSLARTPQSTLTRRRARRIEYAQTQRAWNKNPCNCLRKILKDKTSNSVPPKHVMVPFWQAVMTDGSDASPGINKHNKAQEINALWAPIEPSEIKEAYPELSSSPGPDGLSVRQLRAMPIPILVRIFNLFLLLGKIPKHLLESKTILIPKKDGASEPGDYRPITISSVITRTYHKILARRIMRLVNLDKRQKAFIPADGCAENIFDLDMVLRYHRQNFKSLFVASIDIAKAFDSVSHNTIRDTLLMKGIPSPMVQYIMDVYARNDMVFVTSTPHGLQLILDLAADYLAQCGLRINAAKSFTVAIKNIPHVKKTIVDGKQKFRCAGQELPSLKREDEWKYLGVPFTPEGRSLGQEIVQLRSALAKLTKAPLKPQQRLFALRVMVLPSLYHLLTLGNTTLSKLKKIDSMVRGAVRKWLGLSHDVVNAYIHANAKDGGLSIPSMRWLMPLRRRERLQHLSRNGQPANSYLSQEINRAKRRLMERRDDLNDADKLDKRWASMLHSSNDGKALKDSRKVPQQHQWITNGNRLLSGRDFVNMTKLRINAMPSRARTTRGRIADRNCRAGCNQMETTNHILQKCHRTHAARIERHNAIVAYIKRGLGKSCQTVDEEPTFTTTDGIRKPDLIAKRDNKAIVIDAQIISENYDLAMAHRNKVDYYRCLKDAIKQRYKATEVKFTSATLSYRGVWSQHSVEDLIDLNALKKKELKIVSTRVLAGGLSAFWMFNRMTSCRRHRQGIG